MQQRAVIYVPPDRVVEEEFAARFWYHCAKRGYELYGVLRDWAMVERTLANSDIQIVVMPSPEGRDACRRATAALDDSATVRLVRPRQAVVGEAQQIVDEAGHSTREILAYRNGYAEGYVDCATVRRQGGRNQR